MRIGCLRAGSVTAGEGRRLAGRSDGNIRGDLRVVDCGTGVAGAGGIRSEGLMIEARGLSKRFHDKKRGEVRAVDNVSFRCEPGRVYGLLGANGAGKTTTLRILATILEPTDGTALICGHDVVEEPEQVRANVGFLSTATALYPRLTAQELVKYFGRLNGLDEAALKKRLDDIFSRLD